MEAVMHTAEPIRRSMIRSLAGPLAWMGLLTVAMALPALFLRDHERHSTEGLWIATLLLALLTFHWVRALWRAVRDDFHPHYALDEGLLLVHRWRRFDQVQLINVADISVRRNLFDRLLNTGTIVISSTEANKREVWLRGVCAPDKLRERIWERVQQTRHAEHVRYTAAVPS